MEVNFKLDKEDSKPLYVQLYEILRDDIIEGKIKYNTKLLPIRTLAKQLDINNATVVSAYRQLEQSEYVKSIPGSGTYVVFNKLTIDDDRIISDGERLDFATAWISPDFFPVDDFKVAINNVLDREKGKAFVYDDTEGFEPLRNEIVNYLKSLDIETNYKQIQVVSGAQQGIDIIAKSLINYNEVVIVEKPTYAGAVSSFNSRGAKIIEVPINSAGINLVELEKTVKANKPKFIYLMPNYHNPTGICYIDEVKRKILEIAYENECFIVEDDYLSDITFGENKRRTLKSFDEKDIVIYIKSFSKLFMPGLRLAFMIIPKALEEKILKAKYMTDISTSGLIQHAFYEYLKSGSWKKQLSKMQKVYINKYNLMISLIKKYAPKELDFKIPEGGLNVWCKLPKGITSNILYAEAQKFGINFVPGNLFFLEHRPNEYFRLSFAAISEQDMDKSVKLLFGIIDKFINESRQLNYKDEWFMKFI